VSAPLLASYFNEKDGDGRFYRHPFTGQTAPSVTTINSMVNKDGLSQWKVDMALKEVMKNPDGFYTRSDADFFKGFRYAADRFRDDRAAIGSAVHNVIEAELTNAWEIPEIYHHEVAQCIDQWHLFLSQHEVKPLYVETTLWHPDLPLAGTADLIGWIDGAWGLWDVKTSRKTHHENHLQLAMLANCPEILVQVPEGAADAAYFEKERTVNGAKVTESGWFVSREWPQPIEAAGFIHLRPDETDPMTDKHIPAFNNLVLADLTEFDLLWDEARGHHASYTAVKALEARRKAK